MIANSESHSSDSTCELTFEQALANLEGVIRDLEDGRLELTESLSRYEEGIRLLKYCHVTLNLAERKILLLTGVDAQGEAVTEPYDDQALSLEEKKESRARRRTRATNRNSTTNGPTSSGPGLDGSDEPCEEDIDKQKGLF